MIDWIWLALSALVSISVSWGLTQARLKNVESSNRDLWGRFNQCIERLSERLDRLSSQLSRVEGYLNGKKRK
jgi:hypothetical protein